MLRYHSPANSPAPVRGDGQQVVPEVAGPETRDRVNQAGEHQGPGRFKVQVPAPAILVREHIAVTGRDRASRRRNGYFEQHGRPRIAGFAPIKTGMRDEDLNSADEQSEEDDYRDPVRYADQRRMPGCYRTSEHRNACHLGSIACPHGR